MNACTWSDEQIHVAAEHAADLAVQALADRQRSPNRAPHPRGGTLSLAVGTLSDPSASRADIGWAAKRLHEALFGAPSAVKETK